MWDLPVFHVAPSILQSLMCNTPIDSELMKWVIVLFHLHFITEMLYKNTSTHRRRHTHQYRQQTQSNPCSSRPEEIIQKCDTTWPSCSTKVNKSLSHLFTQKSRLTLYIKAAVSGRGPVVTVRLYTCSYSITYSYMFLQLTPIYIKPIKIPILYIVLCNNKKILFIKLRISATWTWL